MQACRASQSSGSPARQSWHAEAGTVHACLPSVCPMAVGRSSIINGLGCSAIHLAFSSLSSVREDVWNAKRIPFEPSHFLSMHPCDTYCTLGGENGFNSKQELSDVHPASDVLGPEWTGVTATTCRHVSRAATLSLIHI